MFAAIVIASGCLSDWSSISKTNDPSGSVGADADILLPVHRRILTETGWLKFVTSNVDAVEHYDWPAFASSQGPAVGIAAFEEDTRVVRLALNGRDDRDVVATLVHEAAHLSGIVQAGRMYGEDIAVAVERQFLRDWKARSAGNRQQPANQDTQEHDLPEEDDR